MKSQLYNEKVLIITGSLNDLPKKGIASVLLSHIRLSMAEQTKWLSIKIKLNFIETLLYKVLYAKKAQRLISEKLNHFVNQKPSGVTSNLTADSIAHALKASGMEYAHCSIGELLHSRNTRKRVLSEYKYLFLSTTFIHDLNELNYILNYLYSEGCVIVIGGALTGSLMHSWQGDPRIKIVTVGYGEYLIPVLCDWIKSGESRLKKPLHGNILHKEHSTFLIAGQPETKDLDFIPAPSPILSGQTASYEAIHYESVRGCPFRCSFCNYPYLFADNKFRYKSAEKIVNDWLWYSKTYKPKSIVVLDSLFTVPRQRIKRVAAKLIEEKANINWVCYARSNDLCNTDDLILLKQSGLKQVHIGLESGNQNILNNMNKKTTVEENIQSIKNCRELGITTITSVIIGFPGETEQTIEDTYQMLAAARPDFCFVVVFSTRVEGVPILSATQRQRFKLETSNNLFSMSPYWLHETMSCREAADYARQLNQRLTSDAICLDPFIFFEQMHDYEPEMFLELLNYQKELCTPAVGLTNLFNFGHRVINKRINRALVSLQDVTESEQYHSQTEL